MIPGIATRGRLTSDPAHHMGISKSASPIWSDQQMITSSFQGASIGISPKGSKSSNDPTLSVDPPQMDYIHIGMVHVSGEDFQQTLIKTINSHRISVRPIGEDVVKIGAEIGTISRRMGFIPTALMAIMKRVVLLLRVTPSFSLGRVFP